MDLQLFLGRVLPFVNLILVVLVIVNLFRVLKIKNQNMYIVPWRYLLFAVLAYTFEEVITVLDQSGVILIPKIIFPLIEMIIICSFIYMVMMQKKYVDMQ